jgi:hypothetical protein
MVTCISIEMNVCVWNAYIHVIFFVWFASKQMKLCQNFLHKFVLLCIKTSLTMAYVTCRLDRKKNRKIFDWEKHHHYSTTTLNSGSCWTPTWTRMTSQTWTMRIGATKLGTKAWHVASWGYNGQKMTTPTSIPPTTKTRRTTKLLV